MEILIAIMKDNKIVVIEQVDTRAIVRHVREKGVMNCLVCNSDYNMDELLKLLKRSTEYGGTGISIQSINSEYL